MLDLDGAVQAPEIDWEQLLVGWRNSAESRNPIGDTYFLSEPTAILPTLGVYRPTNNRFKTLVHPDSGIVEDALQTMQSVPWTLSESSAAIFIPGQTAVGFVRSSKSAPGAKILLDFLNKACPLKSSLVWGMNPILVDGDYKKLIESRQGVSAVELSFGTTPELPIGRFNGQIPLTDAFNTIADYLNAELNVSINISLDKRQRGIGPTNRLKELVLSNMTRISTSKNAKITLAESENAESEILDLLTHHLTKQFEIPELAEEGATFRQLMTVAAEIVNKERDSLRKFK